MIPIGDGSTTNVHRGIGRPLDLHRGIGLPLHASVHVQRSSLGTQVFSYHQLSENTQWLQWEGA
jgi:hypothetical protein